MELNDVIHVRVNGTVKESLERIATGQRRDFPDFIRLILEDAAAGNYCPWMLGPSPIKVIVSPEPPSFSPTGDNKHTIPPEVKPKETIEERLQKFITQVKEASASMNIGRQLQDTFISYWTEKNPAGKKMRFEFQKVFEYKKRLATFQRKNQERLFPKGQASGFPDYWDPLYEKKLEGPQLSNYWKHLRENCGLTRIADKDGTTKEWIKNQA